PPAVPSRSGRSIGLKVDRRWILAGTSTVPFVMEDAIPNSQAPRANAALAVDAHLSPRILIVRLSAIGDVIHGIPVLCALRDALPSAFIGWIVEGRAADLLEGHSAPDELIR